MGCPDFSAPSLSALASDKSFEVAVVYSMPDRPKGRGHQRSVTPVKSLAIKLGLPVKTVTSFSKSPEECEELKAFSPDFLIVIAYGLILPQVVLDIPKIAAVNIHASLLPRYRGPSPIHFSILNGDSVSGLTAIKMNSRMDEGDILAQKTVTIGPNDTFVSLHDRLSNEAPQFLIQTVRAFFQGSIIPKPQIHSDATYTSKITPSMGQINWENPASTLSKLVRALASSPGAWFEAKGERIKIGAAEEGSPTDSSPGTLLSRDPKSGIQIACGNRTSLVLRSLQRPGKGMMSSDDFLRGFPKFSL
ncbi:methionyl-tRNA formyltransferase [bacterium]|nr:methionyl-tRNA formyltransferase [bacterium]